MVTPLGLPAGPTIADHPRTDHQILNEVILIALKRDPGGPCDERTWSSTACPGFCPCYANPP